MSFESRRELLFQVAPLYRVSGRKEKSAILKEFIESTGYSRKYAIRLLSLREIPSTIDLAKKGEITQAQGTFFTYQQAMLGDMTRAGKNEAVSTPLPVCLEFWLWQLSNQSHLHGPRASLPGRLTGVWARNSIV